MDGGVSLENSYTELMEQAEEVWASRVEKEELPPTVPPGYPEWSEILKSLEGAGRVARLEGWERAGESGAEMMGFAPTPNFGGHLRYFLRDLRGMLEEGHRVTIVSHQAERLAELLAELDIFRTCKPLQSPSLPFPGTPKLVQGALAEGWTLKGDGKEKHLVLFTDKEIFGYVKQRRASRRRPLRKEAFASDITVGDYVVHIDHGIGRFVGVTTMRRDEGEREYLTIEYADSARLYVPNDSVDRVTPYIGSGGGASSDEPARDTGVEPGQKEGQGVGGEDSPRTVVPVRQAGDEEGVRILAGQLLAARNGGLVSVCRDP